MQEVLCRDDLIFSDIKHIYPEAWLFCRQFEMLVVSKWGIIWCDKVTRNTHGDHQYYEPEGIIGKPVSLETPP